MTDPTITPASDAQIATEWAKEILGWSPRLKAATPGMFDAARGIMAKDATIAKQEEEIERLRGVIQKQLPWMSAAQRLEAIAALSKPEPGR